MATSESYFDNNTKERKERTEWHSVVVWGKRGEALSKLLSKGSRLCVEGRLQTRSWDDKQGAKRYTTEIVANNVVLLDSRRGDSERTPVGSEHQGPADDHDDEDIPF